MLIASTGLNLPEGKVKYEDPVVIALTDQFSPKKVTPYYCEFRPDDYQAADAIAIARDSVLDLLIHDIDKLEVRRHRTDDPEEQASLDRVLAQLEKEVPVCDQELSDSDHKHMLTLGPLSLKPTLILNGDTVDTNDLIRIAMERAGVMFFYTAGTPEVHAWFIKSGSDAVTCAGAIHSDLARGFVKAEIVSVEDLLKCHNLQDARRQGLTQLDDHDHIIQPNSVLDIRFNV